MPYSMDEMRNRLHSFNLVELISLISNEIGMATPFLHKFNDIGNAGVRRHFGRYTQFTPDITIGLTMRPLKNHRLLVLNRIAANNARLIMNI